MKAYGRVGKELHSFIVCALYGGQQSASGRGRLNSGRKLCLT